MNLETTIKILSMDISLIPNDSVKNINEIYVNRLGDFGINNKRELFVYVPEGKWRSINPINPQYKEVKCT